LTRQDTGSCTAIFTLAALPAADAGQNLVQTALTHLVGQLRVGNGRAAHGDEVRLALPQQAFRHLRVNDFVDGEHRNLHHAANLLRVVGERRGAHGRRRGDDGAAFVDACGDVQRRHAGFLQNLRDDLGVLDGQAALHHLVGGDAVNDRIVLAHQFFGPGDDFQRKTQPVPEIAAVFVGALVGERRDKLVDEIAVGAVQLNGVVSGIPPPANALGKLFHQFPDLLCGQLTRAFRVRWGPELRRVPPAGGL
jgi:hypothetical protein